MKTITIQIEDQDLLNIVRGVCGHFKFTGGTHNVPNPAYQPAIILNPEYDPGVEGSLEYVHNPLYADEPETIEEPTQEGLHFMRDKLFEYALAICKQYQYDTAAMSAQQVATTSVTITTAIE